MCGGERGGSMDEVARYTCEGEGGRGGGGGRGWMSMDDASANTSGLGR